MAGRYKGGKGLDAQNLSEILKQIKAMESGELDDYLAKQKEKLNSIVMREFKSSGRITNNDIIKQSRIVDAVVNEKYKRLEKKKKK